MLADILTMADIKKLYRVLSIYTYTLMCVCVFYKYNNIKYIKQ